ncbi:hypothetical protein AB1Y20_012013 [Prymnesium parvum]|uniref:REJ domain-containing protein n=1 Tax=Prymnesium parvum TaxID=97485 RepID=A0AB34IQ10_PRYPA
MFCHFGEIATSTGEIVNLTHAACQKPVFPNSVKGTRRHTLRISLVDDCFVDATATFLTYNAQVDALSVYGAPMDTSIKLNILGAGFPYPLTAGSICRFSSDALSVVTEAVVVSSTRTECPTPAAPYPTKYEVALLLNGQLVEPYVHEVPTFTAYDLGAVTITKLLPAVVPISDGTTVLRVQGRNFAEYGSRTDGGQLTCAVGTQLIRAQLLSSSFLQCVLPAFSSPTDLGVRVSLNGGDPGTFTEQQLTLKIFQPPTVSSISPTVGDADGGESVTIYGSCFTTAPASSVRCAFDGVVQPQPPSVVTANQIVCLTAWGAEEKASVPVAVSLNEGLDLHVSNTARITFKGFHRPQLIDAYFSADATTLVLQFDDQPTNQAGINGRVSCGLLLDASTMRILRGSATYDPLCTWQSPTKLVAHLTVDTAAAPAMRIGFRPGVLWPAEWSYPGSCDGINAKCNTEATSQLTVDQFFPCDIRSTSVVEQCIAPQVALQAPSEISFCPDATVRLDASHSTGSGIKPLSITWGAYPLTCDNYYEIRSRFQEVNSLNSHVATLVPAELLSGSTFVIWVQATNFVGMRSSIVDSTIERRELTAPDIYIEAPALLYVRPVSKVSIAGNASLPSCFERSFYTINFEWRTTRVVLLANPTIQATGNLTLEGSSLQLGLRYTLRITGCMAAAPSVCGFAEVDVALESSSLTAIIDSGQARAFGSASAVTFSGCSSTDPDDPQAVCATNTLGNSSCGTLRFAWACAPIGGKVACPAAPHGEQLSCAWILSPRSFEPGVFNISLTVRKVDSYETATASIRVTVTLGDVPAVVIDKPQIPSLQRAFKPSPTARLVLSAVLSGSSSALPLQYKWSISSYDTSSLVNLTSSAVTSTGDSLPHLVVLANVLRPGAAYTFQVSVTSLLDAAWSSASTVIEMNAPPYGGTLRVSPAPPYYALTTSLTIVAEQWFDDPDDLPLSYAFFYSETRHAQVEKYFTAMGQAVIGNTKVWRNPPPGNFTISCKVFDTYNASATVQRNVDIKNVVLDSNKSTAILSEIQTRFDVGDITGMTQLIDSLASSLNAVRDNGLSDTASQTLVPDQRAQLRQSLIATLKALPLEGIRPLAKQQRAAVMQSLLQKPSELTTTALVDASAVVDALINASFSSGLAQGTAERLLGSIGCLIAGNQGESGGLNPRWTGFPTSPPAAPPNEPSPRHDASVPVSPPPSPAQLNTTEVSNAAQRTASLRSSTEQLAKLISQDKVIGEQATAVSAPSASLSVGVDDPCTLEGKPFASAPFDDQDSSDTGSITFSRGALCPTVAGRRMEATSSCGDSTVTTLLTKYKTNVHAAESAAVDALAAPVLAVQVNQCEFLSRTCSSSATTNSAFATVSIDAPWLSAFAS